MKFRNGSWKHYHLVNVWKLEHLSNETVFLILFSSFYSVDNSEYMRNGDFLPTRLQAQQDAVGLIAQSKLRSNPESNVGLLTLSGLEGKCSSNS